MTNTLNVSPQTKQVSETESVTEGYTITVNTDVAELAEFSGKVIYASRSALKAVVKAVVLTSEEKFLGWSIQVEPETAKSAGVANLENLYAKAQWDHVKAHASQEFDPEVAVATVKTFEPAAVIASTGKLPQDPNDEAEANGSAG